MSRPRLAFPRLFRHAIGFRVVIRSALFVLEGVAMRIHRLSGLVLLLALALAPLGLAQSQSANQANKTDKKSAKSDKKTKNNSAPAAASTSSQATAGKPAGIPPLKLTDTKLANGMRVIIAEDHSAPVFGIAVTYNVGARNERPGRTGFAHLFEHMMFEGSENVGKGEHFILIENNGGGMNGTTNEDRTNYYEVLPKNQLELALFLEADRMGHLAFTQEKLDNQRKAVQEERRLGVDNEPYGKSD